MPSISYSHRSNSAISKLTLRLRVYQAWAGDERAFFELGYRVADEGD